jgi:hypothetical protein
MNLIDKLFHKHKPALLIKSEDIISCEQKTPIMAIDVSYSNGRFRRYINFTCPKCNKEQSKPVWSDMEHIDPDTYDCECGEILQIWVKEHTTELQGFKVFMGYK